MYALFVTFQTTTPLEHLETPFTDYAGALRSMKGLLSKAWIQDGTTLGGFHLFTDKAAADAYLSSDLATGLIATDGFDDFEVRGFDVLEGLSRMTGVADLPSLAAT